MTNPALRLFQAHARWLLLILTLIFYVPVSLATTPPPEPQQVTSVEGVSEYVLKNGLRVLLAPDASRPSITVNMTYLVGSRHENYGETGMAHLLEHMLFRGTPTLRNALGEFSRRGLSANGTTNADRTNYYASFAADAETLDWYLRWQADVMVNALILREDLDAEMTVVRNEMERGENSPFQMLMQKTLSAAYQWHNYGNSTIGARSDVENVDIEQLRAFYRTYYQPDNAVLIVTGKFDEAATLKVINEAFSAIPRPDRKLPPEYTVEPVQDGERQVVLRRQGGSPLAAALYHAPAAEAPDFVALDMATAILADTPSGPLYKALVESGLASSVFGFTAEMRQPGYVFFGSELRPDAAPEKALSTLISAIENDNGAAFTVQSLERIKSRWTTAWEQTYSDPASLASALSESASEGDWRLFFLQRDRLEALSLESVKQAAKQYLLASNRSSGLYLPTEQPQRAPQASPTDLTKLLEGYTGRGDRAQLDTFDATPANIDKETLRTPLALANGTVKLALLPKPTAGNQVDATLVMQFGSADDLKGLRRISSATAALLDHGTDTLSRQEIEDQFTRLRTSISFSGEAGVVVVRLSTQSEQLPAALELALTVLKRANFPEKELQEYKAQVRTALNNALAEPSALASRALARHDNPWPPEDPRYTPTFEEEIKEVESLTAEQLKAFHKRFYGTGNILLSVVGDFDPQAVKTTVQSHLNDWKTAPAYQRLSDPYRHVAPETFLINTPDKANAFYLASAPLKLQDTDPNYPALYVANYLLGGSQTSRLWNRIREQDGLSYTVGSSLDASSFEASGGWSIYAIHAPENSKRLQTAITQELDRILADGFSDQEVQQAVTAILNFRKLARARDEVLVSSWINYLQLERTFAWSAHIDTELSKLTAEQVNQAVKKWIKPSELSVALAADQAKQKTTP